MSHSEVKEPTALELTKGLTQKVGQEPRESSLEERVRAAVKAGIKEGLPRLRKGSWSVEEAHEGSPLARPRLSMKNLMLSRAKDEQTRALQDLNDKILLASSLLRCDPRALKMYQEFQLESSALRKALDTATTGEGVEFVPTSFSALLIDKVHLQLKVASLHEQIQMPTNPYKLPVAGADAVGYLSSEQTGDNTSTEANKITASTPGTKNVTFTAKKIAGRVVFSEEMNEDSVIPVLDFVLQKLAFALAYAIEDATVNGDTDTTHMDSDVTSASDARKAWDGYRELALTAAKVDLATFNVAGLRSIREKMGLYGVDPNKLAWVVSIAAYLKMLSFSEVMTLDKYGAQATILTGELGRLDGIPIIVSEKVRQDLNATGVYDGITTTKTMAILAYRSGFIYGVRREITLKTAQSVETDQSIVVAKQRLDFQSVQDAATEKIVGLGYNIAT